MSITRQIELARKTGTARLPVAAALGTGAVGALALGGAAVPAIPLAYIGSRVLLHAAAGERYRADRAALEIHREWVRITFGLGWINPEAEPAIRWPNLIDVDTSAMEDETDPRIRLLWQPPPHTRDPSEDYPIWSMQLARELGGETSVTTLDSYDAQGPVLLTEISLRSLAAPDALTAVPISRTPGEFPLAMGDAGRILRWTPRDNVAVNLLVSGEPGAGKSTLLRLISAIPYQWQDPGEDWRVVICDCKGGTDYDWALSAPWNERVRLVKGVRETRDTMAWLAREVDNRYEILSEARRPHRRPDGIDIYSAPVAFADISLAERARLARNPDGSDMGSLLVVVDEYQRATTGGRYGGDGFQNNLRTVTSGGRAAGIHCVLAAHRADASETTGYVRQTVTARVLLGQPDSSSIRMMFDEREHAAAGFNISRDSSPGLGHVSGLSATGAKEVQVARVFNLEREWLDPLASTGKAEPRFTDVSTVTRRRGPEGSRSFLAVSNGPRPGGTSSGPAIGRRVGEILRGLLGARPTAPVGRRVTVPAMLSARAQMVLPALGYGIANRYIAKRVRDPQFGPSYRRHRERERTLSCDACGALDRLQIDHRHPHALGGTDTFANAQALCSRCHRFKTLWDVTAMRLSRWLRAERRESMNR